MVKFTNHRTPLRERKEGAQKTQLPLLGLEHQRCLHVISAWSDVQQLKLSPSKCTVMHLSYRRANHVFTFPYGML